MRLWSNCNHIVHSESLLSVRLEGTIRKVDRLKKPSPDCLSPIPSTAYLFFPLPSLAAFLANILLNASLPLAPSGLAKAPGTITPLFGAMV